MRRLIVLFFRLYWGPWFKPPSARRRVFFSIPLLPEIAGFSHLPESARLTGRCHHRKAREILSKQTPPFEAGKVVEPLFLLDAPLPFYAIRPPACLCPERPTPLLLLKRASSKIEKTRFCAFGFLKDRRFSRR